MRFSPSPRRGGLQLRISERRLLLMLGDILAVEAAVFIGLFIWSQWAGYAFTMDFMQPNLYWFVVLPVIWLLLAGANDFYELPIAADRWMSLQRLLSITGQMLIVYLLIFFFSPREALPRLFILYYAVASFVLISLWRMLNPALIGWAARPRRVLVVGAGEAAQMIIDAIQEIAPDAYDIRGVIGNAEQVGQEINDVPVKGTGANLLDIIQEEAVSETVITTIPNMDGDVFRGLMRAYEMGVELIPMPLLYSNLTGRVPVLHVNNNWATVLPLSGQTIFDPYPLMQRSIDLLLGLLGGAVFLITYPFLALLIRLDSPGPALYRQRRTGLNGREFNMVKYRTMINDAEKHSGAQFSYKGDPRVTRVGRWLRRTRLDEIPQVINVLRGDMSIVGPRPERPEHIDRLTESIPFYRTRLVIRPGLTGWAQVRYEYGSNDSDAMVKLEYDLYYIRNQTLLLDLNIMIRTIGKVLRMGGV